MVLVDVLLCAALAQGPAVEPEQLWAQGRRAEAIAVLAGRVAEQPRDEALRRRLVEWELAVHWYEAALEHMSPLGGQADRARAEALFQLGRWEEALALLDPADPLHALMRVESCEALGRFDDAARELERAAQTLGAEHSRVLALRGRALARAGRHTEAAEAFGSALRGDPLDAEALFGLGRALVASGEREKGLRVLETHRALTPKLDALDFARRSVDLAPLHGPNHAALGDAWRALGRSAEARASYARASELSQGEALVPVALRHARLLAEDLGDADAAVAVLEQAAQRHADARLYVRAGDLLLDAGRPFDALQRFQRAGELRPGDAEIQRRIEQARAAPRGGTKG